MVRIDGANRFDDGAEITLADECDERLLIGQGRFGVGGCQAVTLENLVERFPVEVPTPD